MGAEYEHEIAETLSDRIEVIVDARVQARLAEHAQQMRVHRTRWSTWASTVLLSCGALVGAVALLIWFFSTDPVGPYVQALCVASGSVAAGYALRRGHQQLSA